MEHTKAGSSVLDTGESSWVLDTKKRGGQLNVGNEIVKIKEEFSCNIEMKKVKNATLQLRMRNARVTRVRTIGKILN